MTQRSAIADTICRTIELGVTITDAAIDAEDQTHLFCQVVAPKDACPSCRPVDCVITWTVRLLICRSSGIRRACT
ncbi:putative transposase [Gordonia polyisoprenivorans NBRC 16320 = JCM 10675]|nr:putative transposase [Gordonia polyisoprenivorans NBRC 16320 = JCM 10675]